MVIRILTLYGLITIATHAIGIRVYAKMFGALDRNTDIAIRIVGGLGILMGIALLILSAVLAIFFHLNI